MNQGAQEFVSNEISCEIEKELVYFTWEFNCILEFKS